MGGGRKKSVARERRDKRVWSSIENITLSHFYQFIYVMCVNEHNDLKEICTVMQIQSESMP